MDYSIRDIASVIGASTSGEENVFISHIALDSRKLYSPASSIFFALKGPRRDGHQFIPELYKKGVRCFVVNESPAKFNEDAIFLVVPDTLDALQKLAASHRQRFDFPVVGITGSNGKTIVKEWLYQLLHEDYQIVRSPRSYNSQIGVPLSIWQMDEHYSLGIFEAGISRPGEMENLERIIQPTIGVLTNIGEAHSEGFASAQQKLEEKLTLFSHCQLIIGRGEDLASYKKELSKYDSSPMVITWGHSPDNDLLVKNLDKKSGHTSIRVCSGAAEKQFTIPFTDDASIQNAITCYLVLLQLGVDQESIAKRMEGLQPVNMRLELKKGINHCMIINDSYSADINSLEIALDFLDQQAGDLKRTVILSDLLQSARNYDQLYTYIIERLKKHEVKRVIAIGPNISASWRALASSTNTEPVVELHESTDDFLRQFRSTQFRDELILVKGARVFGFEQIVQQLEQKAHQTVLEINLNAIVHNVKVYQQQLKPSTKIMAMVKAFAYGSGGAEIAGILQYHKVDYLGVAYADEGVDLRKSGIIIPIMVMNPDEAAFDSIVEYHLEPDIFSFGMLEAFDTFLKGEGIQQYPIHIELETGMNRLGFALSEVDKLAKYLSSSQTLKVQSVFTHLSASEDPAQDAFTRQQFKSFIQHADMLQQNLDQPFLRHIANSAAIFRLPELQLDLVRLGIGMYGVDSSKQHQELLQPVATLRTTIAQIRKVNAGESVGYNRGGTAENDRLIATVRIGYADGYSRGLGNGVGKMWVQPASPGEGGYLVPVVGSICMDMTMIDVTGINGLNEGDEVIVFGKELSLQQLADWAGTIPYELMTSVSQRVKRVYYEE